VIQQEIVQVPSREFTTLRRVRLQPGLHHARNQSRGSRQGIRFPVDSEPLGDGRTNEEKMMDQHQRTPRISRRRKALMASALVVGTLAAGGAIAAATPSADTSDEAGGFICYTVDAYGRVNRLCGAVAFYYVPY
jgi:hypothetical protein